MAYDNNTNKTTFITRTGSQIIAGDSGSYTVDISSLIDGSSTYSAATSDSDEIVVVRKFDHSTISDSDYTHTSSPITAAEAWSAWTLPNSNTSGSTMYATSSSDGLVTFSTTAADYTWTTEMSGRAAEITLPVIAAGDTIYILRKTYNLSNIVTFTSGSRITASTLNQSAEQMMFLAQEVLEMVQNFPKLNPSVGQPDGVCPLNADGVIAAVYIDPVVSLALTVGDGVEGSGTAVAPIKVKIDGDSLTASTSGLKADVQDSLVSTSTTKPLSAAQGKALKDEITLLGTGIVYKGGVDIAATYALGAPSAGWTITHTGSATGSSRGSEWAGTDTTGDGSSDTGSIATGTVLRYDGAQWDVVQSSSNVLADGSVALSADWDAGATRTISAKTQAASDSTTKLATTAFVQQEITGTKLSELVDVDVEVDDTAGFMLVWDGDSFNDIACNTDPTSTSNKVMTTGDGVSALADIDPTSPTNGQVLQYTTAGSLNKWKPATITTEEFMITVGGTGDGAAGTDESDHVDDAFNSSNLGHTGSPVATTVAKCTLRNRTYNIGNGGAVAQQVEIPNKTGITLEDGAMEYQLTDTTSTAMVTVPSASNSSTTSAEVALAGRTKLLLTSSALFSVGDLVHLECATDEDLTVVFDSGDDAAKMFGLQLVTITRIDGNTIYFDSPLVIEASSGKITAKKYGTGTGTSQAQLKNLTLNNMRFTDRYGAMFTLANDPKTATDGATTSVVELPYAHGMAVDGKIRVYDIDATGKIPASSDINGQRTLTAINTIAATATINVGGEAGTKPGAGEQITIISTDGTSVTYTAVAGTADLASNQFSIDTNADDVAESLENAIEHASGHNGKITISRASHVITMTQATAGSQGNETTTENLSNTTVTDWANGANKVTFAAGASWDNGGGGGTFATGGNAAIVTINEHIGMHLKYGTDIVIRDCVFENWWEIGLKLERCKNVTIENCTFADCGNLTNRSGGIVIKECDNVVIKNCTFHGCFKGISVEADGTTRYPSKDVYIMDCNIRALEGIAISGGILGVLKVTGNNIPVTPLNPARCHTGALQDTMNNGSGIICRDNGWAGSFIIDDNIIGSAANEPNTSFSTTAYWASGDGRTLYGYDDVGSFDALTAKYRTACRGIEITYNPNRYNNANGGWHSNKRMRAGIKPRIENNTIQSWFAGVDISMCYNKSHIVGDEQQFLLGMSVNDNQIVGGYFGVRLRPKTGGVNLVNRLNLVNAETSRNFIQVWWHSTYHPFWWNRDHDNLIVGGTTDTTTWNTNCSWVNMVAIQNCVSQHTTQNRAMSLHGWRVHSNELQGYENQIMGGAIWCNSYQTQGLSLGYRCSFKNNISKDFYTHFYAPSYTASDSWFQHCVMSGNLYFNVYTGGVATITGTSATVHAQDNPNFPTVVVGATF